ncbi:cytochrome c [Methylocystis parvus]|uniref:SorB family sulfite dehydrogenase c-type cytochrome subunit n=1 Tax=Methylocystis parvus TaxID=134 RepID=UPI003C78002E
MRISLLAAALALIAAPCAAKPLSYSLPGETAELRPGPGLETAQNNCAACHSVDYILTQPPKMGRKFWEGEVDKMIHSYHAPIDAADAQKIVDYLTATY